MNSKTQRINVTLDSQDLDVIQIISNKKKISMSSVIKNMVHEWIEDYEDLILSKRAEEAEKKWEENGKKTISHEEFWERLEQDRAHAPELDLT